jgi:two-component system, LytTR family, sensor kinase
MKRYFLSVYTVHVLVWAILAWLHWSYFKNWLPQIGMQFTDGHLLMYLALLFAVVYLLPVYLNLFVLLPRLYFSKRYTAYIVSVLALVAIACVVKVEFDAYFLTVKMEWMRSFGHYISTLPYLLFTMGLSSWQAMAAAHKKEAQRADALQQVQVQAELKWLKAQVNPHFLFNALNNIYSLVYVKSEEAGPMLLKLSDMMRYVMTDAGQKSVPVEEEIKYLQQFIELNGLKKTIRQKTTVSILNESTGLQVEPLLFINFIENAYKHSNIDETGAWIKIHLHISNSSILFECSNTFNPAQQKDTTTGIGLRNVQQRLALAHPQHQLTISEQDNVYAVRLLIPLVQI